ncbi:MAG: bacillithiol biosynthesis deacetylase BshB1 [Cytophagales bacterium]|nr:bacillithiol biosynthesis deacetylase BshB1 [Cytophagales bacterium]
MKLDILVMAAHPDDAELACGGTIALHTGKGYSVGVADLTRGELGTRGTAEIRMNEAAQAAQILKLSCRTNLKLMDGYISNDIASQIDVIKIIRCHQPEILIINATEDRHPDHARAAELCMNAQFLSGLAKIKTTYQTHEQAPWRPKSVYHYIQDTYIKPNVIVDISSHFDIKMQSIMTYKSQFYDPSSEYSNTYISDKKYLEYIKARAVEMGHAIGVMYGEGFVKANAVGVQTLFHVL